MSFASNVNMQMKNREINPLFCLPSQVLANVKWHGSLTPIRRLLDIKISMLMPVSPVNTNYNDLITTHLIERFYFEHQENQSIRAVYMVESRQQAEEFSTDWKTLSTKPIT